MSSMPYQLDMPVYENWRYAMGCERFILCGRNEEHVDRMIMRLIETIPETQVLRVHPIGFRPAHPVPVGRYFAECHVEEDKQPWLLSLYMCNYKGRYKKEK